MGMVVTIRTSIVISQHGWILGPLLAYYVRTVMLLEPVRGAQHESRSETKLVHVRKVTSMSTTPTRLELASSLSIAKTRTHTPVVCSSPANP